MDSTTKMQAALSKQLEHFTIDSYKSVDEIDTKLTKYMNTTAKMTAIENFETSLEYKLSSASEILSSCNRLYKRKFDKGQRQFLCMVGDPSKKSQDALVIPCCDDSIPDKIRAKLSCAVSTYVGTLVRLRNRQRAVFVLGSYRPLVPVPGSFTFARSTGVVYVVDMVNYESNRIVLYVNLPTIEKKKKTLFKIALCRTTQVFSECLSKPAFSDENSIVRRMVLDTDDFPIGMVGVEFEDIPEKAKKVGFRPFRLRSTKSGIKLTEMRNYVLNQDQNFHRTGTLMPKH